MMNGALFEKQLPAIITKELPPILEERRLIDRRALALLLGVSRSKLYVLQSGGKILPPSTRIGSSDRWRVDDVADWMDSDMPNSLTWEKLRRKKEKVRG